MVKVMYIESIELSNYRNYSNVKVEFGKNTNILYGDNAQGKTNILESIYMAATSRLPQIWALSHRMMDSFSFSET